MLEIAVAVNADKEYRLELLNRYRGEIIKHVTVQPEENKLDKSGLNRLRVLTGGKGGEKK